MPDLRGGASNHQATKEIHAWTINVAGLRGFYELLGNLGATHWNQRPGAVLIQEMQNNPEDWLAVQQKIMKLGYKAFPSSSVLKGTGKKGVLTLIKTALDAKMLSENTTVNGSAVGVIVGDTLVCNNYSRPHETVMERAAELQDWIHGMNWKGPLFVGGDWNEVPDDHWVGALAAALNLNTFSTDSPTRWDGDRCIDFVLANGYFIENMKIESPKISDHKVVSFHFGCSFSSEIVRSFKKQHQLIRPKWCSPTVWVKLFAMAYDIEQEEGWGRACNLQAHYFDNNTQEILEESDQALVDFTWSFTMLKILTAFSLAFHLSLFEIPEDFDDRCELSRVEHLANHVMWERCLPAAVLNRTFPRDKQPTEILIRRLQNLLGRAKELQSRLEHNRFDENTKNLQHKIFGHTARITLRTVRDKVLKVTTELDLLMSKKKENMIGAWKHRMNNDFNAKAHWLNRKKCSFFPSVGIDGSISGTPQQALDKLDAHWSSIKEKNKWDHTGLDAATNQLQNFLSSKLQDIEAKGRPDSSLFAKALGGTRGAGGTDQWYSSETTVIAKSAAAMKDVWECMRLWEETACIPGIIHESKLIYIPKKQKIQNNSLHPKDTRPLTIYSIFWRAWATSWMHSDDVLQIKSRLPPNILGSTRCPGPDSVAASMDRTLTIMKFGATLDFTHCFDLVHLSLIDAMVKALPSSMQPWLKLTCKQWTDNKCWPIWATNIGEPFRTTRGIPQGDPAAPLTLSLLLWLGFEQVQNQVPPDQLMQFIYMDDRSLFGKSERIVREAVQRWSTFAEQFRLQENKEKTQFVSVGSFPPGFSTYMEVLGCIIGRPSKKQHSSSAKLTNRINEAKATMRRIGLLPENRHCKISDLTIFAKSKLTYGWIVARPPHTLAKHLNAVAWRSIGRLRYAVVQLRSLIGGLQFEIDTATLGEQLRIAAARDRYCRVLEIPLVNTALDLMIAEQLEELGWFKDGDSWSHSTLPFRFQFRQFLEPDSKKIQHEIRQSQRMHKYQQLQHSSRHEFEEALPPMSMDRIDMVRAWSKTSPLAFTTAIGGLASCKAKSLRPGWYDVEPKCGKCGVSAPDWCHTWGCVLQASPRDLMHKRFLWPCDSDSILVSQAFLDALEELHS